MNAATSVTDADQTTRFLKVFQHVAVESRYGFCLSAEDFLEQDGPGQKLETDFLDYLRSLSFKERRAFDLAMGYAFSRISDLGISVPTNIPQVLLKASDVPLGSFYNEHRDRRGLFSVQTTDKTESGLCLDRSSQAVFDDGWFKPALLPPVARWMGKQGRIRFQAEEVTAITLDLTTQMPDLAKQPLGLEISLTE